MKILTPVDKIEEVDKLIDMGADEIYCGVLTPEWHDKFIAGSINRRPGGGANFTSFSELERCVDIAHLRGIPVFLTLNEHYYFEKQYPFLEGFVNKAIEIGVDALIIADLALLLFLKQMDSKPRIIISTGGNTFNSETASFYRDLGASRIILPRHLMIKEIEDLISQVRDIEFEVFILNSRCPNVDGFCTFQHGLADESFEMLYKNACLLPYDISVYTNADADTNQQVSWKRQHIWETVHVDDYPCGVCALYEFYEMGITSVKIVGRGNPGLRKIADVRLIRTLLDYLKDKKPTKTDFREAARGLYREIYRRNCRVHMCYYPEVLMG
jgi:putative protease